MPAIDPNVLRLQIMEQLLRLPAEQLIEVESFLESLSRPLPVARVRQSGPVPVAERDWPHAPLHRFSGVGTVHRDRRHLGQGSLLPGSRASGLPGNATADATQGRGLATGSLAGVLQPEYFVAHAQPGATPLKDLLHRSTGLHVNELDLTPGRQVWFNYWDTQLTYESSYYARLNYVHQNSVKHGLVAVANQYRWCSAAWLERTATVAQVKNIYSFKIDRVRIEDDVQPV